MDLFQALILGLVQGVTEFLPISSSAHLILVPRVFGWADQGLLFDAAANTGTTLAVILYYRRELWQLLRDGLRVWSPAGGEAASGDGLLLWKLAIATVPVGVAGLLAYDFVAGAARDPRLIAVGSIVFGLLLAVADRYGTGARDVDSAGWRQMGLLGLAQAIALLPGVSRSGVTMTAALALGFSRRESAHVSFLMAVPVGLLVASRDVADLVGGALPRSEWLPFAAVIAVSALCALLVIHFLLEWLRSRTMMPFVLYRVVLGVVLLLVF